MKYAIACMTCKKATGYDFNTTDEAEIAAMEHMKEPNPFKRGILGDELKELDDHRVLVSYLVKQL